MYPSEESDFDAIDEALTFKPGSLPGDQECFSFLPSDDNDIEFTEDIDITASSPDSNLRFPGGGDEAVIEILDDGMRIYRLNVCVTFLSHFCRNWCRFCQD